MSEMMAIDETLFRQYITLYIQNHTSNQDYFIYFCEHSIINNLFGQKGKYVNSISILQMFNLLLANTNQINTLVYIFSQTTLHQYLFNKFSIFKENSQSIEYYVQLLKTIILKISLESNNSLIKMFCNNRYSSFPLFTAVTTLASAWNLEGLVRVTAQQCVLQLIALINQKEIGRGYLTDMQIIIFFYQITSHLHEEDLDDEGSLKYIIDLIYTLRNNKTSLQFLMNSIINNFIIIYISNIDKIILFVNNFIQQIQEYQDFPHKLSLHLKTNLFNIIQIIYFSRFLNSTYFATLKLIPNVKRIEQPDLMKQYHSRGQKFSAYLLQYDKIIQNQVNQRQKLMLFQSWVHFNSNSAQIEKIKDNNGTKIKKNSGFFGFLFSKSDNVQQYIRNALISVGLNYQNLKFPLYKLTATLNFKTGIYLVQQIITKTLDHDKANMNGDVWNREDYDIHFNDFKGKFQLNDTLYREIVRIIHKLQQKKVPLQFAFQKQTQKFKNIIFQKDFLPQYLFLSKFRQHLASIISDYLISVNSNEKIQSITFLNEIMTKLQINKLLDKKNKQKILYKLQQIHQDINDITFGHHDLKGLIDYVHMKKQDKYKNICYQYNKSNFKMDGCSKIEQKVFYFQFLSQILNPHLSSLNNFVSFQWSILTSKDPTLFLKTTNTDKYQNTIHIQLDIQKGFLLTYKPQNNNKNNNNELNNMIIQIKQLDPKLKIDNRSIIIFNEYSNGFQMKNKFQAEIMISQIQRIRSCREEITTKLIVHYFDMVYNSVRQIVYQK